LSMPALAANSLTTLQTTFSVMPQPQTEPVLFTRRNSDPVHVRHRSPNIHGRLDPFRNGNRPYVAALPDQVNDGPVILPLLKMIQAQVGQFGSAQPATEQDRQHCVVALPANRLDVRGMQEGVGLFGGEPIPESDAQLFCSFDPTNASGQLRTEKSGIGCFVREATNSSQPQIDRGWGQMATLEFQSVSEDNCLTEGKPGLGAVPRDEIIDGKSIRPPRIGGPECVQDGYLVQIG